MLRRTERPGRQSLDLAAVDEAWANAWLDLAVVDGHRSVSTGTDQRLAHAVRGPAMVALDEQKMNERWTNGNHEVNAT